MMALSLEGLNAFLQCPRVEFAGFGACPNSIDLLGSVLAFDETGRMFDSDVILISYLDIYGLDIESTVKFCRDRVNEAKAKLMDRVKEVIPC